MAAALVDQLIAVVSSDERVAVPLGEVCQALDAGGRELDAAIAEANGYLTQWTVGDRRFLTLAPHTAEDLGLRVSDSGDSWRPKNAKPKHWENRAGTHKHEMLATDV